MAEREVMDLLWTFITSGRSTQSLMKTARRHLRRGKLTPEDLDRLFEHHGYPVKLFRKTYRDVVKDLKADLQRLHDETRMFRAVITAAALKHALDTKADLAKIARDTWGTRIAEEKIWYKPKGFKLGDPNMHPFTCDFCGKDFLGRLRPPDRFVFCQKKCREKHTRFRHGQTVGGHPTVDGVVFRAGKKAETIPLEVLLERKGKA